ncbi:MAG: outer membrane protein assembly factor BamB family protein [Candidatus Helarchaeota archaeon]
MSRSSENKKVFLLLTIFLLNLVIFSIIRKCRASPSYEFNPYQVYASNSAYLWAVDLSINVTHVIDTLQIADLNNDSVNDVIAGTNWGIVALNGINGSKLWSNSVGSVTDLKVYDLGVDDSPKIIVGSDAGGIYVLNRTGSEIWQNNDFLAKKFSIVESQNNKLIFGISNINRTFCLNGTNGQELWNRTFENPLKILKMADINNDTIKDALITCYNKLCIVNVTNGYIFWNYSTHGQIYAMDTGRINFNSLIDIFIGTADNKIYALNGTNGQEIWSNSQSTDIVKLKTMDINNDTITEFIAFTCWSEYSSCYECFYLYYLNASTGYQFSDKVDLGDGNVVGFVHDLECGDLDGDGFENELVVSTEWHKIFAIKDKAEILWQRTAEEEFTDIVLTDLNNDSKEDVIIGTFDGTVYAIDANNATMVDLGAFNSEIYIVPRSYSSDQVSIPYSNKEYMIHIIIRNLGTLTPLEFNFSLYIDEESPTHLLRESSITLSSYYLDIDVFWIEWFIPSELCGAHTLILIIDSANEIVESDEGNNRIEIQIQIQWNYYPFLGYVFLFFGIGILITDLVIYQMKKEPKISVSDVPNGGMS